MRNGNNKGFTLLELMITLSVLGILAEGAVVLCSGRIREHTKENVCLENRKLIERAEQLFFSDKGVHSVSLYELVGTGYMKNPECPSRGIYAWMPDSASTGLQSVLGCSLHGVASSSIETSATTGENFNDGNANGWASYNAKLWSVIDGKYYGGRSSPAGAENKTFFGDPTWTDYNITLDAKLINGPGYGIYFRASDYNAVDGYCFQYDPGWQNGTFIVRKITNGGESNPIATYSLPTGYDWRGSEKNIKIEVSGSTYKFYVGDVNGGSSPVMTVTDSTFTSGAIGLRTWSSSYASFDNVNISQTTTPK
ncbi:MAG: family 16 glycoside hydrolase [Candidatus Firestonebacteria bacterium]